MFFNSFIIVDLKTRASISLTLWSKDGVDVSRCPRHGSKRVSNSMQNRNTNKSNIPAAPSNIMGSNLLESRGGGANVCSGVAMGSSGGAMDGRSDVPWLALGGVMGGNREPRKQWVLTVRNIYGTT